MATMKHNNKSFEEILEEASKSPVYKAEMMSLQIWREILDAMAKKKMTIGQLAKKSGVPVKLLKEWMNCSDTMTICEIGKLMAALELKLHVVVAERLDGD